jgi:hypothetical protein
MSGPTLSTIKRLFARSRNRCAFPNCPVPIVEDQGFVTGNVCHIKARSKRGPRYDAAESMDERHNFSNLMLLCARHSRLIDSDLQTYTVETLREMKDAHEKSDLVELSVSDGRKAEALFTAYKDLHVKAGGHVMLNSPGAIQATTIKIEKTKGSVKLLPALGSLGSDVIRRNYVKHLIDRYNEFAGKRTNRGDFRHPAIYAIIKKQFKADWERIPLISFSPLVDLLQERIDSTQLGRINRGKAIKNYSAFDEYRTAFGGDKR